MTHIHIDRLTPPPEPATSLWERFESMANVLLGPAPTQRRGAGRRPTVSDGHHVLRIPFAEGFR